MTHEPSGGSEYQRHVAGPGKGNADRGRDNPFENDSRREDEDSAEELSRGMSEAGREADRYRDTYRSERSRRGSSALSRGRERAAEAYDAGRQAYEWAEDYGQEATRYAKQSFTATRRRLGEYFENNPLMVGAVGVGIGLIVGALMPIARREQRMWRPLGEDLRRTAKGYGADAMRAVRREAERTRKSLDPSTADLKSGEDFDVSRS